MTTEIKTIDIQARRWFQRSYGNTYFSAEITVNFGLESEQRFSISFEYGYGERYVAESAAVLEQAGLISLDRRKNGSTTPLWRYCRDNDIALNYSAVDVSRRKDL